MTRIMRGGRELVVADSDVAEYLKLGYSVIDDQGNVLKRSQAMSYSDLKAEHDILKRQHDGLKLAHDQLKQEAEGLRDTVAHQDAVIEQLNGENATLKTELEKARAELKAAKTAKPTANKAGNTQTPAKPAQATKP